MKIKNNGDSSTISSTNSGSSSNSRELREQREISELKHTNILNSNNGGNLNTTTNEFHNYDGYSFVNTSQSSTNNSDESNNGNLLEQGKVLVKEAKSATTKAETAGQQATQDSAEVTSLVNDLQSKDSSTTAEIKQNEDKSAEKKEENEQLQVEVNNMKSELSQINGKENVMPSDYSGITTPQPMGNSMNMFAMNSVPNTSFKADKTACTNPEDQNRANYLMSKIEDNQFKIGNNNIAIKNYSNTNITLSSNFRQFSQNVSNNAQTKLDAVKEGNDFAKVAITTGEKATKLGQMMQLVGPSIDGAISGGVFPIYELQGDILTSVGTIATGVGETTDGETKSGIKTIYSGLQQIAATYNKYNNYDE